MNLYRSSIRSILIVLLVIGGSYAFASDKSDKSDKDGKGGWTSLQDAEMFDIVDDGVFMGVGGGTLLRSKNAVEARLSMLVLDPGAAYTVWWVIFNKPSKCSAPGCGPGEDIDQVEQSVIYANGFVAGYDGVANVTAHLNAGKVPAGWDVFLGWKDGNKSGLKKGNGNKAEFHMVVRSHGPAAALGDIGFRTSNFDFDCGTDCSDQLVIIFDLF